jgi:quercetin dioxygenase-like cupin family protein
MHIVTSESNFIDNRGVIRDLITNQVDAVTEITFTAGAVRGNHVHNETTQWTYIVEGKLLMATLLKGKEIKNIEVSQGDLLVSFPGEPHAFKAIIDSKILVFTKGPRSGANYKEDAVYIKVLE